MSFSFLSKLLDEMVPSEMSKLSKAMRAPLPLPQEPAEETGMTNELDLATMKKYLKTGDIFKHAYDSIRSETGRHSGLEQVVRLVGDQQKALSKLKGKYFLFRKNEVRRGKRRLPAKNTVVCRRVIKANQLYQVHSLKYKDGQVLNDLWDEYIEKLVPRDNKSLQLDAGKLLLLLRADFHGAHILIESSRNHFDEGLEGIIIKETFKSFTLVTKEDSVKTVMKENIIFGLRHKEEWFKIVGMNIMIRANERSKLKPKWKNPIPKLSDVIRL